MEKIVIKMSDFKPIINAMKESMGFNSEDQYESHLILSCILCKGSLAIEDNNKEQVKNTCKVVCIKCDQRYILSMLPILKRF